MSVEKVEVSVEDDIAAAMEEIANKGAEETTEEVNDEVASVEKRDTEEKPERVRSEDGKFTKAEKEVKAEKEQVTKQSAPEVAVDAPQSMPAALKEKWMQAPPEVREWIKKRELDQHHAMTRHDGELNLGRELKEVLTPYMPIIQAEGGTPAKAVQSLLNTAYQLRTASPERKAQLIGEIAQTYGVDLGQVQQAPPLDPAMQQILQRIDGIENKFTQHMTLQEKAEHDRIMSEVSAFSADPKNVYFEQLKPAMAPLLSSGQAKDLQEAYDMACWANPEIRSTLIAAQQAEELEKRKAEVAKKKKASGSVTGSPGVKQPSSTPSNNNVEDDIRAAMDEILNG